MLFSYSNKFVLHIVTKLDFDYFWTLQFLYLNVNISRYGNLVISNCLIAQLSCIYFLQDNMYSKQIDKYPLCHKCKYVFIVLSLF